VRPTTTSPKTIKRITTQGGRPTNSDLPYFNVETGGGGVIAVISWAGQWAADFWRDGADALRICGGQETTRFRLHPGEGVRSPRIVLQFYRGDWHRAQNVWRSWMIAHNLPRPGGKMLAPQTAACNGNLYPGIITNAAEEMRFLRRYLEEGIRPDYWWQDAGWYPCDNVGWPKTGTWEVEKKRWPKGLREVSDFCRARGIKTLVWFEPERVHAGTWLAEKHPEWIFGGKDGGLLKIGVPECRRWLADHVDRLMTAEGIDLYRQDFNIDPLVYWQANEPEDRQGIHEIRHVEGYFAYWDDLLRRRPGMLIDSCASGGRRNDLETLRRAVPLLKSDYIFEPVGEQNHTYGISFWMPFNGTGFVEINKYLIRSQMSPHFTLGCDTRRKDLDYNLLRKLVREWQQVAPCYFGDYWPLSPYSTANNVWMAWQFDRAELGEGFVQAFRRADCPEGSIRLKLRGLDPSARYTLLDFDAGKPWQAAGRELIEQGLLIESRARPAAILLHYKRSDPSGK
jgi:alpha-galactosidase